MKINLSKFKKIASDDKSTTMLHDDGHKMVIAHRGISSAYKAQLSKMPIHNPDAAKMADGGMVADNSNQAANLKEGSNKKKSSEEHQYNPKLAESKKVLHFADGGEVEEQKPQSPVVINVGNSAQQQPQMPQPPQPSPKQPFTMSGMGGINPVQGLQDQTQAADNMIAQKADQAAAGSEQPQVPTEQPKSTPAQQSQGMAAPESQVALNPAEMLTQGNAQAFDTAAGGLQNIEQGLMGGAKAQGALGVQQAKDIQETQQQLNTAAQTYNKTMANYQQQEADFRHDLQNGHIDAGRFINNMSTGSRVMTGLGLILGGIGGGGERNLVADQLNHLIERDIEAQKLDLGKKENLYSMNLRQQGNAREAYALTKMQMNDMLTHQLQMDAAKSQSPIAMSAAQAAIGQKQIENFGIARQAALFKSLNATQQAGAASGDPDATGKMLPALRQMNPEMAKEIESRYVPGVGTGSVPIPQGTRDNLVAKQTLDARAKDLYNWAKDKSGDLSPTDMAIGKTKAAELQSMYRNAINGGVFKKGEQEFIDNIVDSDPNKFFNDIRVLPKLKTVIDSNSAQLNTLKQSVGLPVKQQQAEPQYKTVGGVKYMRGPNGEAIKVK